MVTVINRSMYTGKVHSMDIEVTEAELKAWCEGDALIQNALPSLSPGEREFLMTGLTDDDWDTIFKDDLVESEEMGLLDDEVATLSGYLGK